MKQIYDFNIDVKEIEKILSLKSAFLFGSRQLGVHGKKSDFDIGLLIDDIPEEYMYCLTSGRMLENYMRVLPSKDCSSIFRINTHRGFDLLVFREKSHYNVFKDATEYVNTLDPETQRTKKDRIRIFEEALISRGWVRLKD